MSGVTILSIGAKRRPLLLNALASVRRVMPDWEVQVVTDAPMRGCLCRVVPSLTGTRSRALKTQLLQTSPFADGVLLDDDTLCLRPWASVEEILGGADLGLAPDAPLATIGEIITHGAQRRMVSLAEARWTARVFFGHRETVHFNSGVIFYRKTPAVVKLGRRWNEEWLRFRGMDQLALARALREQGTPVRRLPPELHHRLSMGEPGPETAIVHFTRHKWSAGEWMQSHGITPGW